VDLRQTKTKMITGSLYTYIVEYISRAKMLRFVLICNYPGQPHVAAAI